MRDSKSGRFETKFEMPNQYSCHASHCIPVMRRGKGGSVRGCFTSGHVSRGCPPREVVASAPSPNSRAVARSPGRDVEHPVRSGDDHTVGPHHRRTFLAGVAYRAKRCWVRGGSARMSMSPRWPGTTACPVPRGTATRTRSSACSPTRHRICTKRRNGPKPPPSNTADSPESR
jgi:hypothetical protein